MNKPRKPRTKRGETLVETLVAILIVVLTSMFFLTTTITIAKINTKTRTADSSLRQEQIVAERQKDESSSGQVEIKANGKTTQYDVTFYGKAGDLQSYTGG